MATKNIVLYHYSFSPCASRVAWYLALRGIPYSNCWQAPLMPRPDLARMGITHRRTPILAIGRDVYLDSRLHLRKLEELDAVVPRLGGRTGDEQAMERLLDRVFMDGGVFTTAVSLVPTSMPMMADAAFLDDRSDWMGVEFSPKVLDRDRPAALRKFANIFGMLETTLLADGREWILKTQGPGLADIEAVWPLLWLVGMPGDPLPQQSFSPAVYPRVFAWIKRFQEAVSAAKARMVEPPDLSGEEAAQLITQSPFHEAERGVDAEDFVVVAEGLVKGDVITVSPTDIGRSGKDVGTLVSIDKDEVVWETMAEQGTVRLHAPRHGFSVRKGAEEAKVGDGHDAGDGS